MQRITPFLWFDTQAEAAARFYVTVFKNSRIKTQAEVDEFWGKLSEGEEEGPCGWLKDRYGLSWQVNPTILGEMLSDPDPSKSKRVMEAMLQMKKIDIAGLKRAYDQH
ncbi:MAG TPA: VOC family protein [Gemmatimonadales bacterium]|jgi:predicted 3-demethylubiquinone-9 3-methyltransferase (glyoxalase superfamily)|nr:VOC family protein [Gemmatimonadales bacterium]